MNIPFACHKLAIFVVLCVAARADATLLISSFATPATQNFNALGASGTDLGTLNGADGWRINQAASFATGTQILDNAQSAILSSSSGGGSYSFRPTGGGSDATDRAVGFLTSGGFTSPRSLMVQIKNDTGVTIPDLSLTFDYEKYRTGTRAFDMTLSHGSNGTTWTDVAAGSQTYAADGANAGVATPTVIGKSFTLSGVNLAANATYYLRWTLAGVGGSTNGQGIGLDNFTITAVPEPSAFLFGGLACVGVGLSVYGRRLMAWWKG